MDWSKVADTIEKEHDRISAGIRVLRGPDQQSAATVVLVLRALYDAINSGLSSDEKTRTPDAKV